ncbi:hypothetical protein LS684_04685 [Cytobacillus spongiae]|uniref:hypothetical protein n=1 Tax=Cytobacillus spongiae TaxID=2901381 RepID=UPI001F30A199|nr:hypothetical protein [Cytobacillus spongiae]UII56767.1 hypothetical protein LS684_04685 [Cytobacillus spongiae]
MKNLKQWLMALIAAFMFVGVATGCSNEDDAEDTNNTEENETEGTEEESGE